MVREFKLVNEKGQEYSLMDLKNYCFFGDPSGLGYNYTTEYQQLGNVFISNLRKIAQGQINGIVNFISYDNYRALVDFVEGSESLRLSYKVPYKTGTKEYFKDVQISNISKTQIQPNGILSETVTFDCLSLWYEEQDIEYKIEPIDNEMRWNFFWNSRFNDNNSTSITYLNKGQVEAPILLEINGAVVNPKIQLYVNGKLAQVVNINKTIQQYEKLIYDSRDNQFAITLANIDGTEESLLNLNTINFENDNVIRLPKNKPSEIRLQADNTITNANLTIFPQYKSV